MSPAARLRANADRREIHPVDQVPPIGQLIALGIQHVLAMYASAVAVPLIIGTALSLSPSDTQYLINACLVTSGIATLIQTIGFWKFGVRLPILQGTAFAAASTIVAIGMSAGGGADSLPLIFGSVMFGGLVVVLIAPVFSRLIRFMPPVVTGTVILVIGLNLIPVAVRWAKGAPGADPEQVLANLALAGGTLLLVVLIQRFTRGFVSRVAILIGLVAGTVAAIPMGLVHFDGVAKAGVFEVALPFHFGLPQLTVSSAVSIVIVLVVIMVEVTGCIFVVGELVDRRIDSTDLARGLRADGLGSIVGGLFNSFPYGAYVSNVGLVAITGVRSRFVVAAGGAMLLVLGVFPKVGALAAAVPLPVLGGAGLVLFGSVAASGVRTLSKVDFDVTGNLTIVSVALGFGLVSLVVPDFYAALPVAVRTVVGEGITAAAIAAILLNLLFFHLPGGRGRADAEGHASPSPGAAGDTSEPAV